jgi:hypothetical protein
MDSRPELRGDRPATYRVTFISLTIGLVISVLIGLLLLALRQPLVADAAGKVNWSVGAFMIPLAGLVTVAILAWSVFVLPKNIARRQGILLDPYVWPATGAIVLGILVAVAFVGAIVFGVI